MITMYSTGCPMCEYLQQKLDQAGVQYEINDSEEEMESLGIDSVPVLSIDGRLLEFSEAVEYCNGLLKR